MRRLSRLVSRRAVQRSLATRCRWCRACVRTRSLRHPAIHGPTFTFDDSVTGDPVMGAPIATHDFIFVSDDLVAPPSMKSGLQPAPVRSAHESVPYGMRDTYFAQSVTGRALPEAKAAALDGRPALVVFWQHNPDI